MVLIPKGRAGNFTVEIIDSGLSNYRTCMYTLLIMHSVLSSKFQLYNNESSNLVPKEVLSKIVH